RDGNLIPYEHKRGKARRDADGQAAAWETDALQVAAYAMMLEETHDVTIPEGRVRYHRDNVTVRVPVDAGQRGRVTQAVARARALRNRLDRPGVTGDENLCRRCSLAPVCLPEEGRQAGDPLRQARRLFPDRDSRTSLHVVSPG